MRTARLRRNLTVANIAERAGLSPGTVLRLEKGDPGVGMGTLVLVMWLLGLNERMMQLVDETQDLLGRTLESECRRKRARSPR
ncbi:helix-turn-helix domain-containing protein [Acidithiobacillus thiooxidans]|uniref:helix-turn-helix domain-containing protein n=1 Tax=Acidithiobacillus thiooxidans TaxID=930 RepID=UPI001D019B3A|nr:helix-turn-helix transcriptional regulator [Acidithiobacillus thiooxidans]